MEIITKAASATVPDEAGQIEVTWATLGVVDRDGDIIEAAAVPRGQVVPIMPWGHNHLELPVGEAVLDVDGDRAVARGRLYLGTTAGRDHYEVLRERGDRQEWSFGFRILEDARMVADGVEARVIRRMEVREISPVLMGAGIGTRTEAIKSRMGDHVAAVRAAVGDVVWRAESLADLRAKEGRMLSAANRQLLGDLLAALREAADRLDQLLQAADARPVDEGAVMAALKSYALTRARTMEVMYG